MGQKADGYTRVRRALLKDPINRTEQDVNTLMTKLDKMHIKFWAKLAHNVKRLLCKFMSYKRLAANRILFRQGAEGKAFFLTMTGSVARHDSAD